MRSRSEDFFERRDVWNWRARVRRVFSSWRALSPGVLPSAATVIVATAALVAVVVMEVPELARRV